jgi:hypothetical protein
VIALGSTNIAVRDDLAALIRRPDRPLAASVHEGLVLHLYATGVISSGKAAELLEMDRFAFIPYASHLGIPYYRMSGEEWEAEEKVWEGL